MLNFVESIYGEISCNKTWYDICWNFYKYSVWNSQFPCINNADNHVNRDLLKCHWVHFCCCIVTQYFPIVNQKYRFEHKRSNSSNQSHMHFVMIYFAASNITNHFTASNSCQSWHTSDHNDWFVYDLSKILRLSFWHTEQHLREFLLSEESYRHQQRGNKLFLSIMNIYPAMVFVQTANV